MASIPNNGYAAVMAGTNVYTGSNFFGSDCPKTPIAPTDPDDLCNKLYVDTIVGGGSVVSVTGGNNILVTPTTVAPVVSLQRPLTASLDVGTQDIISTTSTIDITPLAGQDCNVTVSGAGGLHVQQTSAGGQLNPLCRLTNTNATGSVALEVYKNKPTAVVNGDILHNLSVYGKDSGGAKQEYTRITHVIRDGVGGTEDGSIEFGCFTGGAFNNFLQINGVENEVNCLKTLDMGGNNISTSTGNMAIVTTASTGTGTLTVSSKQNIAMTANNTFTVNATSGQVGITANQGIGLVATTGGIQATATTGGINLTANSGGIIQNTTTGSFVASANTSISLISSLGVMNMTNELHYGKMTTPYANQVYQSTYQPILTAPTNTFPVAEIQREGQQVIFINSAGDGANELTALSTPNFSITACLYKVSINQYIAGGWNHIDNRCEIRCGGSIAAITDIIGSGSFTYIKFPSNTSYFVNVVYNSPLYPDTVAVGGQFFATPSDSYDGAGNLFPSFVSNFLCVDAVTATIAPLDMFSISDFTYGVDGVVTTINAQSNTYYTPASQPVFILGGKFLNITTTTGPSIPADRTAVFCQNGLIVPFGSRWNSFISANNTVNKIWVYDDRVVFGGLFTNIGGVANDYLAFSDATLPFPTTSLINGFIPPASINSGFEVPSSPSLSYFGCNQDPVPEYPVYTFNLTDMSVTPTAFITTLPAVATGFATNTTGAFLDYIVGHNSGSNNYCYKVQVPDFIDLNGATYLQNIFLDPFPSFASPNNTPVFFRKPDDAVSLSTEIWFYEPLGSGSVAITTTDAFPFVSVTAPANNWKTITLGARNNYAQGTVVQFGTDDQRIVILASNGASFSN